MKSFIRIFTLLALSFVAIFGLFTFPLDSATSWLGAFLFWKAAGFAALIATGFYYSAWRRTDKSIRYFHENFCEHENF